MDAPAIFTPPSIQEAVITPLIATAQTTEERVAQLIADFQRELEETRSLTTTLKTAHESLTGQLESEDLETRRLTEEHAALMQALDLKVNEMTTKIAQHQSSLAALAAQREQEENALKPLHNREVYLNTRNGVMERFQALCRQGAQAYEQQKAREYAEMLAQYPPGWKFVPQEWNRPD